MSHSAIPFGLDADLWFVTMLVAMGCGLAAILGLAGIVAWAINSIHRRRVEEQLKQDMLDRGMNADEIVRVIEAAMSSTSAASRVVESWAKR